MLYLVFQVLELAQSVVRPSPNEAHGALLHEDPTWRMRHWHRRADIMIDVRAAGEAHDNLQSSNKSSEGGRESRAMISCESDP